MNKLSQVPKFEDMMYLIKPEYHCPTCRKRVKNKKEVEFLKNIGECSNCDHIRSDIQAVWEIDPRGFPNNW